MPGTRFSISDIPRGVASLVKDVDNQEHGWKYYHPPPPPSPCIQLYLDCQVAVLLVAIAWVIGRRFFFGKTNWPSAAAAAAARGSGKKWPSSGFAGHHSAAIPLSRRRDKHGGYSRLLRHLRAIGSASVGNSSSTPPGSRTGRHQVSRGPVRSRGKPTASSTDASAESSAPVTSPAASAAGEARRGAAAAASSSKKRASGDARAVAGRNDRSEGGNCSELNRRPPEEQREEGHPPGPEVVLPRSGRERATDGKAPDGDGDDDAGARQTVPTATATAGSGAVERAAVSGAGGACVERRGVKEDDDVDRKRMMRRTWDARLEDAARYPGNRLLWSFLVALRSVFERERERER